MNRASPEPAMNTEKYNKLVSKLRELFQLDQPDLDFGIYRVMHLKREAVERYLDPAAPDGLRAAVESVFESTSAESAAGALEKARAKAVEAFGPDAIGADGALTPVFADTPVGKAYTEALATAAAVRGAADGERDVYDLLLDFFSRYYEGGDFVSLRRITRETGSRALSYAIPYGGEEVKLHWANADQYYIKTSENFSTYDFDLSQAKEIRAMDEMARIANGIPPPGCPMPVHLKIVAAEEGVHGNAKPDEERYFSIDWDAPFDIPEHPNGELTVFFHHEADPDKPGNAKNWQKQLLKKAKERVLECLESFTGDIKSEYPDHPSHAYLAMFKTKCPTDGNPDRVLLDRYLEQYAARNTEDYFIHKDLGGFFRRELEFYVKNEILNVSDLARQSDETLLSVSDAQLRRARAFYRVARHIVDDFLAPLENFQKQLWLKKKFVVQCDWCITMDQVPEELRAEVLANEAQQAEWKRLNIDTNPKANSLTALDARMVDTQFFPEGFKAKLLASIPDLDAQCDGVIVRSENFQALRLMLERYKGQIKCIYIDPPYNTGNDDFLYKDGYKDSSWLSMMVERVALARNYLCSPGFFFASIDDNEIVNLRILMKSYFSNSDFEAQIVIQSNKRGQTYQKIAKTHEYLLAHSVGNPKVNDLAKDEAGFLGQDENGLYELWELRNRNPKYTRANRPNLYYPIYVVLDDANNEGLLRVSLVPTQHSVEVYPRNSAGADSCWRWGKEKLEEGISAGFSVVVAKQKRDGGYNIYEKARKEGTKPKTIWAETEMISEQGTVEMGKLGITQFAFPKPLGLIKKTIQISCDLTSSVLDFFAGSGTTGHAVIDLNREEREKGIDANRKYILVEMGEHFDTVLKPRLEKVVYSPDWKDGKPESTDKGISHCFKYLTLESYEDTLNNLNFDKEPAGAEAMSDYLLRYMLDEGTRGSPSRLDVAAFAHPFSCTLDVKKPGSEERVRRRIDLVETFGWLLGMRVRQMSETMRFAAEFKRIPDPDLPADLEAMKLRVVGQLRKDDSGPFVFRTVEGTVPREREKPDGEMDRVLVVWREGTGDPERDNAALDSFLKHEKVNALDGEYDIIYVNGSNNVPSLRRADQTWKVRLIEETFVKRMWEEE